MKSSDFDHSSGKLVRDDKRRYDSFVPASLPFKFEKDDEFIRLLSKASQKLGELKGLDKTLKETLGNITEYLIIPYLQNEAVLSSKIEGTVSTLQDVMENELNIKIKNEESRGGKQEVINYIHTQEQGASRIRAGSNIDINLIKFLHSILLKDVRGKNSTPGSLRKIQNYITQFSHGTGINNAIYIPPPQEMVQNLLVSLFQYMDNSDEPILMKLGMMHYQFEAIHPFLDGNGRIGRLLILLYLIKQKELEIPLLYLSGYFEKNRNEYYSLLIDVSMNSNYLSWMKFFLNGVIVQSDNIIKKTDKLIAYYDKFYKQMKRRSKNVIGLFQKLFLNPYITIPKAAKEFNISYPTAKKAVYLLVNLGILRSIKLKHKGKVFIAINILDIYIKREDDI